MNKKKSLSLLYLCVCVCVSFLLVIYQRRARRFNVMPGVSNINKNNLSDSWGILCPACPSSFPEEKKKRENCWAKSEEEHTADTGPFFSF